MGPAAACRATNFSTGPEDQFFSSELLRRQIQFCFICWQRSVRSGLKQIAKGSFFPEDGDAFVICMYSQTANELNYLYNSAQNTYDCFHLEILVIFKALTCQRRPY